jgi:hypothetical protein
VVAISLGRVCAKNTARTRRVVAQQQLRLVLLALLPALGAYQFETVRDRWELQVDMKLQRVRCEGMTAGHVTHGAQAGNGDEAASARRNETKLDR